MSSPHSRPWPTRSSGRCRSKRMTAPSCSETANRRRLRSHGARSARHTRVRGPAVGEGSRVACSRRTRESARLGKRRAPRRRPRCCSRRLGAAVDRPVRVGRARCIVLVDRDPSEAGYRHPYCLPAPPSLHDAPAMIQRPSCAVQSPHGRCASSVQQTMGGDTTACACAYPCAGDAECGAGKRQRTRATSARGRPALDCQQGRRGSDRECCCCRSSSRWRRGARRRHRPTRGPRVDQNASDLRGS
jgi:hypothetical protein